MSEKETDPSTMAFEGDFVMVNLQDNQKENADTTTDQQADAKMGDILDKATSVPVEITQTQNQYDAETDDERGNDDETNGKLLFL